MRAAAVYFALVFGAGFLLGPIRVLFLEPRVGVRAAELTELPLMIVAITFAARFILRRYPRNPIRTGLTALALLLGAEITVGMALRGLSLQQILFDRDPVSGPAYYASLAYFAVLPWYLSRR
jgi:hypothetical protein